MTEHRADHGQVMEVAGGEPGIVGDVLVALPHGLGREAREEMLHRFRHGVDVARRAGHGLGDHAAPRVEHAGREIARLADRGGEGRAHQRLRLLLDQRLQPVPCHLQPHFGAAVRIRALPGCTHGVLRRVMTIACPVAISAS